MARVPIHPEAFSLSRRRIKQPRVTAASHLDFIRQLPCVIRGTPAEAAHIRYSDMRCGKRETGKGEKPSDIWSVPLCAEEHRLGEQAQHRGSEREFWRRHGIDPCVVALALWAHSGDFETAEIIIREAQSARRGA